MANFTLDKVKGMMAGVFLGDALGAPHESFRHAARLPYSGRLQHRLRTFQRGNGWLELDVGQVTDDSEMTLALARRLVADGAYRPTAVVEAYFAWANSGCWNRGYNVRKIFSPAPKTLAGKLARITKQRALPLAEKSQSNGALMRCAPLALLAGMEFVREDCGVTNSHPNCVEAEVVYIHALRRAGGADIATVLAECRGLAAAQPEVAAAVDSATLTDEARNVSGPDKGWALHALWVALRALRKFGGEPQRPFSKAMEWVITQPHGSDTDTNAAIAGALLGAHLGYARLQAEQEENLAILLGRDPASGPTPRPPEYSPRDFHSLCEALHRLAWLG